ncbi:MAG: hypothetical protein JWN04_6337 [Myxococcaceae bacterium]|nr:hypothetical protein [Myxococcaceae bacterium]
MTQRYYRRAAIAVFATSAVLAACHPAAPVPQRPEPALTTHARLVPALPPLPDGYDWSLALGGQYKLEGARPTTVDESEKIISRAYIAECLQRVGAFPLPSFDCADAQAMPVTGLANAGDSSPRISRNEAIPANLSDIARCDRPSLIYRDMRNIGCSSGSRIRRVSTETTDWVYICRKAHSFFSDVNLYSEIGLIGNNRSTGDTCFFAGRPAVNFTISRAGVATQTAELAALTGQRMAAPTSEQGIDNWSVPTGQGCVECHSQGPWLNFPFVDGASSYAELSWHNDDAGDPQIVHTPVHGYLQADGKPVVPPRHPGMLYAPLYPSEVAAIGTNKEYRWQRAMRLDPRSESTGMCTTCHHIGNQTYGMRYPKSAFYFQEPLSLAREDMNRQRAELYLANITEPLRGSHNTRLLTRPWAEAAIAQVPGFAIVEPTGHVIRNIAPADIYKHNSLVEKALERIASCGDNDSCWTEHWTLARVEAEPLRYLQETCSHCHGASAKVLVRLSTKQQFMKGGDAWSRLNSQEHPHPPGGRLDAPVLEILGRYLKH